LSSGRKRDRFVIKAQGKKSPLQHSILDHLTGRKL